MAKQTQFHYLFQPGKIGTLQLKNRLIMPPMATNFGAEDGQVTTRFIEYHRARAHGGVALNIVEAACIDFPQGRLSNHQISIDNDKFLPGLSALARAIHDEGGKAAIQIHHAGRTSRFSFAGAQPVAPSPVSRPGFDTPRELTIPEIQAIIARFADAARRAQKAGFDGVEIHAAHDHLLAQFLSPFTNRRQDAYGGPLENRARAFIEVIKAVRQAVGREYPVWCRINGELKTNGGMTADDSRIIAKMAAEAGVDAIHMSTFPTNNRPLFYPVGFFLPLAEGIKKVVNVPVITGGRMTPEAAEEAIKQGRADFISFGKSLIADPDFPNKLAEGRRNEINPCISCLNCLNQIIYRLEEVCCVVNPRMGHEGVPIKPSASPKKVMVIGGGPAGMEAARVAALRGHHVDLYDKGKTLGGQLNLAAVPPFKGIVKDFKDQLEAETKKAGVQVHLGTEVKLKDIEKARPDAVIIATGGKPLIPKIPGMEKGNIILAEDVLSGRKEVGEKAVIIGGGLVGCEVAEFLAEKGKKVTIIEMLEEIGADIYPPYRVTLMEVLGEKGIAMFAGVKSEEIAKTGLIITNRRNEKVTLNADTIVLAVGYRANTDLVQELKGKVREVQIIGDCVQPRRIKEAMAEGLSAGMSIP